MLLTINLTITSHCSDCGNTVPASPGHGSLELAPPKHQTEVITGAWSLLSIDIGNAVKIISTSTTGSPFPVTVKLQRPVHCHPARLCGVCCVTSHMYNIWNNVTWWDNRLLCRCCPPAPLYWSIKIYSIHCMQHWRGGAGGEAMSTLSKARIMKKGSASECVPNFFFQWHIMQTDEAHMGQNTPMLIVPGSGSGWPRPWTHREISRRTIGQSWGAWSRWPAPSS